MIERTFDAEWFNDLCNKPEVRPMLGGTGPIDVSATILNPVNYALRTKHGGFILIAHGAGVYSVHTQFAAEGRGKHAIAAMQAGLDFMFTRTDAMQIFSHCPDANPAALGLARAGGASMWFRNESEPTLGPGQVVRWDILNWLVAQNENVSDGENFHALLETARKEQFGNAVHSHDRDETHDRVVGAAVKMCKRGQPQKGVNLYNIWASQAGYAPITLLSCAPPVVDVGDGIVGLDTDGELEVLLCR